eukprot:3661560-Karenia_brevis.AAC.1
MCMCIYPPPCPRGMSWSRDQPTPHPDLLGALGISWEFPGTAAPPEFPALPDFPAPGTVAGMAEGLSLIHISEPTRH